jgi:hypothetical protein
MLLLAWLVSRSSKNATYMGTIRREVMEVSLTPQRPNVGIPANSTRLTPDWIAGFVDGEGCFHVGISKHPEIGYQILPEFTVVQHRRDLQLLHELRSAIGCGVVRKNRDDRCCLRVHSLKNLREVIVPFFEKNRLRSKKGVEFRKFARVVKLMARGDHLTEDGFDRICRIASSMNRGERRIDRVKRESIPE